MVGQREEHKEEMRTQYDVEFKDSWKQDHTPFQSEVKVRAIGWLLCFSDLRTEHQYVSQSFYYLCYSGYAIFKCYYENHYL